MLHCAKTHRDLISPFWRRRSLPLDGERRQKIIGDGLATTARRRLQRSGPTWRREPDALCSTRSERRCCGAASFRDNSGIWPARVWSNDRARAAGWFCAWNVGVSDLASYNSSFSPRASGRARSNSMGFCPEKIRSNLSTNTAKTHT